MSQGRICQRYLLPGQIRGHDVDSRCGCDGVGTGKIDDSICDLDLAHDLAHDHDPYRGDGLSAGSLQSEMVSANVNDLLCCHDETADDDPFACLDPRRCHRQILTGLVDGRDGDETPQVRVMEGMILVEAPLWLATENAFWFREQMETAGANFLVLLLELR